MVFDFKFHLRIYDGQCSKQNWDRLGLVQKPYLATRWPRQVGVQLLWSPWQVQVHTKLEPGLKSESGLEYFSAGSDYLSITSAMNCEAACACSSGGPDRTFDVQRGGISTLGTAKQQAVINVQYRSLLQVIWVLQQLVTQMSEPTVTAHDDKLQVHVTFY